MPTFDTPDFQHPDLIQQLSGLDDAALDRLPYGVIGFDKDAESRIQRYNLVEQRGAGLEHGRVVGQPLFTVIAQCMNNYLVAQRFADAVAAGQALDTTLDFTFTWRMKPTPVVLRLLSTPDLALQYVAIDRSL